MASLLLPGNKAILDTGHFNKKPLPHCQCLIPYWPCNPTPLTICLFGARAQNLYSLCKKWINCQVPLVIAVQLVSRSAVSGQSPAVCLIWSWTERCSTEVCPMRAAATLCLNMLGNGWQKEEKWKQELKGSAILLASQNHRVGTSTIFKFMSTMMLFLLCFGYL